MARTLKQMRLLEELHQHVDPKASIYEEGSHPAEKSVFVKDADGVVHEIVVPVAESATISGWARLLGWLR